MMSAAHEQAENIYELNALVYLEALSNTLSPSEQGEHYQVIRLSLLGLQKGEPAIFELALRLVAQKLGIKSKAIKEDLARSTEPPAAKEARELLEQMGQTRTLRLAQDFVDGKLWFGVIAGGEKLLVNSDRELLILPKVPRDLTVKDNGFDYCRLSKEGILHFLSGGSATGYELLADLRSFFTRFAVFRDKRIPLLLATWVLGTYLYTVFRVFPYLALRSPDKRCGKSRVLDLLSLVAFNASQRVTNPTEAQIFRGPSRNGGALLLDEIESLKNADKENYAGLLAVLNSGFERGGSVSRMAKDAKGNFQEVSFETYCPRALAGISKTAETLEDRSIIILMQRKLARERLERFSPSKLGEEAQALRDRCYIWALTHAADLAAVYDGADKMFPTLSSLDDRARDLWEPLISITAATDVERNDEHRTLTDELTALSLDLCQIRNGTAEDSTNVLVLKALQAIFDQKRQEGLWQSQAAVLLAPEELARLMKEKLGWEKLSSRGLATLLNPLGLYSKHTWGEARGRRYHLSEDHLKDLASRYGEESPGEETNTDAT